VSTSSGPELHDRSSLETVAGRASRAVHRHGDFLGDAEASVPVTEVLEQLLLLASRGGADATIDVRGGPAIRGGIAAEHERELTRLAARTVRELGGRRRRTTPSLAIRLDHDTLEVAMVDRAGVQDVVRLPVVPRFSEPGSRWS
jgi:hypothetical protein